MKYYTWKLKWEVSPTTGSEEGTDPTNIVNNDVVRVEPLFNVPNEIRKDEVYYAVCIQGSLIPSELTEWFVEEISAESLLTAAQTLNSDVTLVDGLLVWPSLETQP
jgi:hypothetical protein